MAVKSAAFSSVFSFFKPFRAAQQLTAENSGDPASPKTPICNEGQEDSSTTVTLVDHQRKQQQQRVFVVSPPVSPFTTSVAKETTSGLIDPASFLIERLEKGWFEENVVGISGWWDVCSTLSWPGGGGRGVQDWRGQPTTSDLMAWVPTNDSDSELFLGPPARIRTPNLGSSSQLHLFPTIELASTSGNSLSTARDPAGLPGSRLRKLPRVYTDNKISHSDKEQRHRPRSLRTQSNDLLEAVQQFNDKQSKIRLSTKAEKPAGKLEVASSDKERFAHSRIEPIRDSTKVEKPAGKLEVGSSDRERRRVQKHDSTSMPVAPRRRRREDRKKLSISLTEGEFNELTGVDLNSTRNCYTPPGTKEFAGLKWYMDGDDVRQQSPNKPSHRSRFGSPRGSIEVPPSKGMESPLLKAHIPSNISSDADIKAHLKFWAHSVASTVSAEC